MTREEAIKCLEVELRIWERDCKSKHDTKDALKMAIKALEQKPETVTEFADRCRECGAKYGKALEQTRWIPCSEKLPKENGEYLVYCEIFFIPDHIDEPNSRKGMAIAYYHREFNEWLGMDKVYAWMPLPKPYKAESEVKG